jgi:hypothetical protein
MSHEVKRVDLTEPYWENQQWCVDEQLYPEARGFIHRTFDTLKEAQQFIEGAK